MKALVSGIQLPLLLGSLVELRGLGPLFQMVASSQGLGLPPSALGLPKGFCNMDTCSKWDFTGWSMKSSNGLFLALGSSTGANSWKSHQINPFCRA